MPGVAVVTGAGQGFGRAICERLASRGYTVLATDVDAAAAAGTAGASRRLLDGARRPRPRGHRAAARAAAERGPLEVWVNNAGVMRPGPAWKHSDEDVRLTCDVNMLGVIWGSLAAVEAMRAGPGENRHVINLASLSALGPVPGLALYIGDRRALLARRADHAGGSARGSPARQMPG